MSPKKPRHVPKTNYPKKGGFSLKGKPPVPPVEPEPSRSTWEDGFASRPAGEGDGRPATPVGFWRIPPKGSKNLAYGGFLKWCYPTTMGFPTKNDHFGMFWGYHHLRKHPYSSLAPPISPVVFFDASCFFKIEITKNKLETNLSFLSCILMD